jgi:hypothetical protein
MRILLCVEGILMPKSQSRSKTTIKTGQRAEYDLYTTPRNCVKELLERENFNGSIWEPACGKGDISEVLLEAGHSVLSTDIVDHGYDKLDGIADFLKCSYSDNIPRNIITNPPFNKAFEFVKHSFNLMETHSGKIAMFLRLSFAESQKRKPFFLVNRPNKIYVFSKRQTLWRNGEPIPKGRSGTTAYSWWVWHGKGWKKDQTTMDWI